jgi:HEPN domain-containing protein
MSDDERCAAAKAWLARAHDDLRSARIRLRRPDEMSAEIGAFHAQQAAEKAMKAVLIRRGVAIPRTHDLEELHRLVGGGFEPKADELAALTPYAVQFRYPDWPMQPAPSDDDVREAIDVVERVIAAAGRLVETAG